MSLESPTGAVFGRRAPASGATPVAQPVVREPAARFTPAAATAAWAVFLLGVCGAAVIWAAPILQKAKLDLAQTERQVIGIINQPVAHVPRTDRAGVFSPGWFHPGAIKPDFAKVDIRQTQEFPYDQYDYVTSDVDPQNMYAGHDLEFNAMTKYFYVDRSVPKKRLSDDEMLEINRLYRVIAQDQQTITTWWLSVLGAALSTLLLAGAPLIFLNRNDEPELP